MNISRSLYYIVEVSNIKKVLIFVKFKRNTDNLYNHLSFLVDGNQIYRYNVTKDKRITMQEDIQL